ncbi:MAG TPA: hypothetical protein VEP68_03905, partial [Anaeromyxobacteraceae bacterium]|nr:hypothetical protein [Anaeromyxobacteraceae bacterium]
HLKSTLAAVDGCRARDAIRAALPSGLMAAVEAANGFDWLPAANDVALVKAIHGALGDAEHDAFSRGVIRDAFEGPLLGPLIAIALRLFPGGLMAWAHWIPRAWALVFRECGEWKVEGVGPGAVDLQLGWLPPICVQDAVWPGSVASSTSALLDLARVRGTLRLTGLDRATRTASYQMRWQQPDRAAGAAPPPG